MTYTELKQKMMDDLYDKYELLENKTWQESFVHRWVGEAIKISDKDTEEWLESYSGAVFQAENLIKDGKIEEGLKSLKEIRADIDEMLEFIREEE